MSKHPKADLYRADRDAGMKYKDIAAKHGVCYQTVAQACASFCRARFTEHKPESVVYPNLRRWMNDNKITKAEFVRRMGKVPRSETLAPLSDWLRGDYYPSKKNIDKMLAVTGLTYEELFATEEEQRADCEWCWHFKNDPQHLFSEGDGMYKELVYKFCPACGKGLEVEG